MTIAESITVMPVSHAENPWKMGDLRGEFPDSISPSLFERVGGAIGTMLSEAARVLVMGDFRLSTPVLKDSLIQGLLGTGVTVLDAGQGPTPLAYFSASQLRADAVLMVTASHNPPSHNGLKLMIGATPPSLNELAAIRELATNGELRSGSGRRETVDLLSMYERSMLEHWRALKPARFSRLVLDAGNGAWSDIVPRLFETMGFNITCISCVTDGNFPDRPSDCSRTANLASLRAEVPRQPNSLGIAWDGDGDRVAFVDEDGAHVSSDEIAILLARHVLTSQTTGSEKIVVDIKFSDAVVRDITAHGGTPLLERTGHTFMRRRMVAENALIGLDACGHFFFRSLQGGDDGVFAAFALLELLQAANMPLSELRHSIAAIYSTPELRIPKRLLSYEHAVQQLLSVFPAARTLSIDGVRLMLEDGVILIRESGTEPVLSLRIEGIDLASYHRLVEMCLRHLPTAEQALRSQLSEQG